MSCLGNIIWFFLGGIELALGWCAAGVLWCITIVGIPAGVQCFKLAGLCLLPFGKEVVFGGGAGSLVLNIFWLILSGIPLAVSSALLGAVYCVTIVGIPFGLQCFKIAQLSLMPFGATVK